MEKKRYKIKCPVHSSFLSQEDYFQIRAWFCPQCEKYYTDAKGNVETIRIHGKTVSPLPKHIVEAIHRAESTTKRVFTLNERYGKKQKIKPIPKWQETSNSAEKVNQQKKKNQSNKKRKTNSNPSPPIKTEWGDINVSFCRGCGRYFMSLVSYKQYRKKYGGLLTEYDMSEIYNSRWWSDYGLDLAPDSILSRCGYSVRQGVPATHRQNVLKYVLQSGKGEKYKIIELISSFIKLHSHLDGACARWKEDILFVNEYEIHKQKIVEGLIFETKA